MTTKFDKLKEESIKKIDLELKEKIKNLKDPQYLINHQVKINNRFKDPINHIIKSITKKAEKEKIEVINKIKVIEESLDFSGEFIITVEWKKSQMWGSNPRAYTNYGFESDSIGGCGYDKLSTATAKALNSNKSILKLMYIKKDNQIDKHNHELIGYGSGYGLLPYFEGGVGVSSHIRIIEDLGLIMKNITSTKNTDVFLITKKDKS